MRCASGISANQMKRDLIQWGHGSIDDEKVIDDIARLTDGIVQIDLKSFKFDRTPAAAAEPKRANGKKKK